MEIRKANINDVVSLAKLLDKYRSFYQQESNINAAKDFLTNRIKNNESVIFLAIDGMDNVLGFTQLYPTFSSVSIEKQWILNDLFVVEKARKQGVAEQLMRAAEDFAKISGAGGLSLSTGTSNICAQALYEKRGWVKESDFYFYHKKI